MLQYHQERSNQSIWKRFRSNLYGVEKPFMKHWLTGKDASSFFLFIIKISKISCPITLSSSNFETREFTFKVAIITFFILFILTFLSSVMHTVFDLDDLFESEFSFRQIEHLSFATWTWFSLISIFLSISHLLVNSQMLLFPFPFK